MKALRIAIVCSLAVFSACGASKRTPLNASGGSPSAGADGMEAGEGPQTAETFGRSACRACLGDACAATEMACTSEPACARYLSCIDACPLDDAGGLDALCAAGCKLPAGSEIEALALHVTDCRDTGHGTSCDCPEKISLPPVLRQVCGPSTDPDLCHTCEDERCCDTKQACLNDDDCVAFLACSNACFGLPACDVDCADAYPAGYAMFVTRLSCVNFRCRAPDECGDKPDPCVDCWHARCAEEYFACASSAECARVNDCEVACKEGACRDSCSVLDPEGIALSDAFFSCTGARCISECAGTGDEPP